MCLLVNLVVAARGGIGTVQKEGDRGTAGWGHVNMVKSMNQKPNRRKKEKGQSGEDASKFNF